MRLYVREAGGPRVFLVIPNGLLCSRLTARLVMRFAGPELTVNGTPLTEEQLLTLFRAVRQGKRQLRGRPLLEAREAGGSVVRLHL